MYKHMKTFPLTMKKFLKIVRLLPLLFVSTSATGFYLTQPEAISVETELTNDYNKTEEELMELAGRSAASAIVNAYPKYSKILVVCGSGNNGGCGLVCARQLKSLGYAPVLYYPYPAQTPFHKNLVHQCESMNITTLKRIPIPKVKSKLNREYELIVDALYGVNFKPPVPHQLRQLMFNLWETVTPIASIDVPSGWHVELGPSQDDIRPEFLISLSAPKHCAKFFEGKYHYLGGFFLPPALQEKYNVSLPPLPGNKTFVRLYSGSRNQENRLSSTSTDDG